MENQEFNNTNQHTQQEVAPMKPKNWLTESILITILILCCNPGALLGIVAIIFASKVNNRYFAGQYAEAERAAKNAKMWFLITVAAVVAWILFFVYRIWSVFGGVTGLIEAVREQMELMEGGGSFL